MMDELKTFVRSFDQYFSNRPRLAAVVVISMLVILQWRLEHPGFWRIVCVSFLVGVIFTILIIGYRQWKSP